MENEEFAKLKAQLDRIEDMLARLMSTSTIAEGEGRNKQSARPPLPFLDPLSPGVAISQEEYDVRVRDLDRRKPQLEEKAFKQLRRELNDARRRGQLFESGRGGLHNISLRSC
jgi:hypothetical protein